MPDRKAIKKLHINTGGRSDGISMVQAKIEKKETLKKDYGAEGMHEAFREITKAMEELAKYPT